MNKCAGFLFAGCILGVTAATQMKGGLLGCFDTVSSLFSNAKAFVTGETRMTLEPYNVFNQAQRAVDAFNLRQACTQQMIDEIGRNGPDRRTEEERKAALSACDGIMP